MGLVAIKIHHLQDPHNPPGLPGEIPWQIAANGFKAYTYMNREDLAAWIEEAARLAGRPAAWAQAVEKAGTLELDAVIGSLRANEFDTIYGRIGFEEKGDVTGYQPFAWYVWQEGDYEPVDPAKLTE